jgi:hypothetical protein
MRQNKIPQEEFFFQRKAFIRWDFGEVGNATNG